jgi:cysteinyl-tRNA synthetase
MRWPSPWGEGFPGWHLECSVMGEKYLGQEFDIHGGGMDLMFPHHECEIAQNQASRGTAGVRYWVHNNMITINGQKMGKSLGNFITLPELFSGNHPKLEAAYSPMTIRFFILQAHYRSTLDFSNEALQAAEKGYKRVMQAYRDLCALAGAEPYRPEYGVLSDAVAPEPGTAMPLVEAVYDALCDDMNTPIALAHIFEAVKRINSAKDGKAPLPKEELDALVRLFDDVVFGVLGLRDEETAGGDGKAEKALEGAMELVLETRRKARAEKNWVESDRIRDLLAAHGITVKDTKDGATWNLE